VYKYVYFEVYLSCSKYVGTNVNIILLYILYCIAYLHTGSMEQRPSWETNRFSDSQEIPPFYGTQISIQHSQVTATCCYTWAHTSESIQVWGTSLYFLTWYIFTVRNCSKLIQPLSWSWLSATAYSIYLQLPSILLAIPPFASWGHTMSWWRVPTCIGYIVSMYNKHYCFLSSWYVSFLGS